MARFWYTTCLTIDAILLFSVEVGALLQFKSMMEVVKLFIVDTFTGNIIFILFLLSLLTFQVMFDNLSYLKY
jgi:hypothetical protein